MEKQIILDYKTLNSRVFHDAFKRLASKPGLHVKVAYEIAKLAQKIDREMRTAHELSTKLQAEHIAKPADKDNPEAEYVGGDDGKTAFEKAWSELLEHKITLDGRRKLTLDEIAPAGLSATDLLALEAVIEES